jgi:hypothetical protein
VCRGRGERKGEGKEEARENEGNDIRYAMKVAT